ncbi:MAG: hypothetical protein AAF772_08530, partial [Acidobacteriota bacterium]
MRARLLSPIVTRRVPRWLAVGLLALMLVVPAQAQSPISGLRVTPTAVDDATGEVNFDITVIAPLSASGNFIGNRYVTAGGLAVELLSPATIQAVDFGDGTPPIQAETLLAANGTVDSTFRGGFNHVYAAPGVYTIETEAFRLLGPVATGTGTGTGTRGPEGGGVPITTGTPIIVAAG